VKIKATIKNLVIEFDGPVPDVIWELLEKLNASIKAKQEPPE
jgi:hypothetical protein